MSLNALRNWGIFVNGALIAGALALAAQPQRNAEAAPPSSPQRFAQAEAAPVAFLVRFRGSGPIARAQAEAARGREASARREIEAQLARQAAFSGLCFDRFTIGAAEVVLRSCEPVARTEQAAYQQLWLTRLRSMRAVAYADANASATQDRSPG